MPDFIPPGLNPLEIPEIVAMVGQQIPLCRRTLFPDPCTGTFTNAVPVTLFAPKGLLACTAVCQAWRRILLPVLWRYYDGALMRHVPLRVLQKASVYFRIFRDPIGQYHPGPFFSTHLQQLIISQQHEWAVPFLVANRALKHLTWTGLGRPLTDQQFVAMVGMTRLRDLCLSNCSLDGLSLASILSTSPALLRLSLSFVDGITHMDRMETMSSLEEIALGYLPVNSQGAVLDDLIRFCPKLRRISFLGTWGPSDEDQRQRRDLLKLSSILRVFCPELESIQITAAYCFGVDRRNTLWDFELAALAESAARLSSFGAEISSLERMLTDALICQGRTLVAVDLCIRRKYPHQHPHDEGGLGLGGQVEGGGGDGGLYELDILGQGIGALAKHSYWDEDEDSVLNGSGQSKDIENAARILTHCSNLRVFRLTSDENWFRIEEAMALFARPWACLRLEVLSLGHISMPASPPSTRKRRTTSRTNSSLSGSSASSPRAALLRPTKRSRSRNSPKSVATPIPMSSSYPSPSPSQTSPPTPPSPRTSEMRTAIGLTMTSNGPYSHDSGATASLGEYDRSLFPNESSPLSLTSPPSMPTSCFPIFPASARASPSPLESFSSPSAPVSAVVSPASASSAENDAATSLTSSPSLSRAASYASISSGSASSSSSSSASSSSSSNSDSASSRSRTTWAWSRSRSISSCSSSSSNTGSQSEDDEDDVGWKFGDEFKQRLIPQVTLLTVLRELCLNKVRYARTTIV